MVLTNSSAYSFFFHRSICYLLNVLCEKLVHQDCCVTVRPTLRFVFLLLCVLLVVACQSDATPQPTFVVQIFTPPPTFTSTAMPVPSSTVTPSPAPTATPTLMPTATPEPLTIEAMRQRQYPGSDILVEQTLAP